MRLQSILLLAAAAILISVDATANTDLKTTQARSLTGTGGDVAAKRILRASVNADEDDEEERAFNLNLSNFRKWLHLDTAAKISTKASTTKVASKIAVMDDQVDDVLKGLSLKAAFTKLNLDKLIANPDELFTNHNFKRWIGHMAEANKGAKTKNDGMTVAKFLKDEQGDEVLANMLSQARKSKNPAVRSMGSDLQKDHWKQLIKDKQSPADVAAIIPSLSKELKVEYKTMWDKAIDSAKRASEKTKEKLRANAAADVL